MMEIVQIGIPKPIADEVYSIIGALGYHSLTEFCVEATRIHLEKKRYEYEIKKAEEEERVVKKHEEGEESIEHQFEK